MYSVAAFYLLTHLCLEPQRMRRSFELCMANCQLKISPKLAASALELYQGILKEDKHNLDAHEV